MTDIVIGQNGGIWIDNHKIEGVFDISVNHDIQGTEVQISMRPTNVVFGEIADRGIDRYVEQQKSAGPQPVRARGRSDAAKSVIGAMQTDEAEDENPQPKVMAKSKRKYTSDKYPGDISGEPGDEYK